MCQKITTQPLILSSGFFDYSALWIQGVARAETPPLLVTRFQVLSVGTVAAAAVAARRSSFAAAATLQPWSSGKRNLPGSPGPPGPWPVPSGVQPEPLCPGGAAVLLDSASVFLIIDALGENETVSVFEEKVLL